MQKTLNISRLAPVITGGFRAVRNFEIPEIELPKLKRKDNRYKYEGIGNSILGRD